MVFAMVNFATSKLHIWRRACYTAHLKHLIYCFCIVHHSIGSDCLH